MEKDFHLFQTDHLFFNNLGLSVFTTGVLSDWWSEETNRSLVKNAQYEDLKKVLGIRGCVEADKNGECNKLTDNVPIYWDGFTTDRVYPTIGFYEQKTIITQSKGNIKLQGWTSSNGILARTLCNRALLAVTDQSIKSLGELGGLIKLNEIISSLNQLYSSPRTSRVVEPQSLGLPENYVFITGDGNYLQAANELLQEIKTSKTGYITLLGRVSFTIYPYEVTLDDDVDFKLFLFDDKNSDISENSVTLSNFKLVGQTTVVNDGVASTQTKAGKLDLPFNPRTNKYESGPYIFFAKLKNDIGPALDFTNVEVLQNQNIQESLASRSREGKLVPATGIAIPFVSNNGNEKQWSPQYALSSECDIAEDQDALAKKEYVVYNNSSSKFKKDDLVQIVWAGGRWNVVRVNEPETEEEELDSIPGQKWGEFTYFMTNSNFFFTSAETYKGADFYNMDLPVIRFSPRDAELSFHSDYYKYSYKDLDVDRANNYNFNYGLRGGYNDFNTKNIRRISLLDGFFQVTSFDFLDKRAFGLRLNEIKGFDNGLCSISHTNADRDSTGKNITHPLEEYATRNAAHCGIFFGCLFPDGYDGFEEYKFARNFEVVSTESPFLFFNTEGSNKLTAPFASFTGIEDYNTKGRTSCLHATVGSRDSNFSRIDDIAWERGKPEFSYDIFYDQQSLNSMPADVMLNASPVGQNGSPIRSIHNFDYMHAPDFLVTPFNSIRLAYGKNPPMIENEFDYFTYVDNLINRSSNWLYKKYDEIDDRSKLNTISAFDFKPKNPNHIMFRPLKFEAYTQFFLSLAGDLEGNIVETAAKDFLKDDPSGLSVENLYRYRRLRFLLEAWRTQINANRSFSDRGFSRELNFVFPWVRDLTPLESTSRGPFLLGSLNSSRSDRPQESAGLCLLWGGDVIAKPMYRNLHRGSYWNLLGPMSWQFFYPALRSNGWEGAGAFGVITTSKTIAARNSIEITTNNRYGMGAQAGGKFTIEGGHANQYRTWGVSSFQDSYRQENIHDLSVRIFQHHPRDQTIFDPRTFAVHHFNPRVDLAVGKKAEQLYLSDENRDVVEFSDSDQNGNPIVFYYFAYRPLTSVDIKFPCRFREQPAQHQDGEFYIAQPLRPETLVYSDVTIPKGKDPEPPVIDEKCWISSLDRIGKLLPYRYAPLTIGIPCDVGRVIKYEDGFIFPENITGHPREDLVVVNAGYGYSEGDIVGNLEFGIVFSVALVNNDGEILRLRCIDAGSLPPTMTSAFNQRFFADSFGPIPVEDTILGQGLGFSAYYAVSRTYYREQVDPKPKLIHSQDQVRVASNIPEAKHSFSGNNRSVEPNAFVQESRSVSFQIDDSNRSSDNLYDIFFHFHNDITMTWLASNQQYHGDISNVSEALEQFISATITAT